MTVQEIIAEIIGLFGIAATIISYQCKARKHILLWQLFSTTCWMAHFAVLGALSGAALNLELDAVTIAAGGDEEENWILKNVAR